MQSATTAASTTAPASGPIAATVPQWLQFPGWRIVGAVLMLGLGVLLSRYVVRLVGRSVAKQFRRQSVAQTVLRLIRVSVVLLAAGGAARILGLEVGDLVLSVTVFSAVLGIVLAPIVGSIINGLFILADQPYEIGDLIELTDGRRAFVDEITIRYTKLFTLNNTFLVIPNSVIRDQLVTNYSAEDERVRLSLDVLVTYESDTERAKQLLRSAAADDEAVIGGGPDIRIGSARYPARPTVLRSEFADDGVLLRLRYWAHKPYKIPTVESRVRDRIWDGVAETDGDVEFAYPHRHLVFDDTSGTLDATVGKRGDRSDVAAEAAPATRRERDAEIADGPPSEGAPPGDASSGAGEE
ncbi:mechanosensitive ion channel family protein [Halobellus rubicundus]|uniref:Mechanosensitive ion channel family protein n=1 Tax=Halobellus rubicundus TaxID=2996466 RepID=A0ABD5MEY0_9EURY